jgi:hypothetical protein
MSQSNTRIGDVVFVAGEDLSEVKGLLVKVGNDAGEPSVVLPDSVDDVPLYLLLEGSDVGGHVSLRPLVSDQNVRVILKGSCLPGDALVLADTSVTVDKGKVRALPEEAGSYRGLLVAEESGVDGQELLARPAMMGVLSVSE